MNIQVLPPHVANQIAAGEVIERPASVVKELVDNALDAKASQIYVDIHHGGLNQIQISDDGTGIEQEDLPLAIASHATSKLKTLEDLYSLESFGFRGEALASIASIAHVTIDSKTETATSAMRLNSNEQGIRLTPCARNRGTTITVVDLFYNAPVRKKFLKSAAQEFSAIETVIKRIALANPEVGFCLLHDAKTRLLLEPARCEYTKQQRLTKIFGKAFADEAKCIDVARGEMRLHGFVSGADYSRSQQDKMWFYINQRMVRDKLLIHALRQAYTNILPEGRFPACVLFLDLPLTLVDINVHPTKHEVRFQDARAVHDLIHLALAQTFTSRVQGPAAHAKHINISTVTEVAEVSTSVPAFDKLAYNPTDQYVINEQFLLVKHKTIYYLIDALPLHRAMRRAQVSSASQPWQARPLLVPLTLTIEHQALLEYLGAHQAAMQAFGLCFEINHQQVFVKSIPVQLPYLSLNTFFSASLVNIKPEDWASALIAAETFSLVSMPPEERAALITYWQAHRDNLHGMSMPLDVKSCRGVFESA